MSKAPAGRKAGATFETARRIALALPEVTEGTCYGTPAFRVRGKLFARLKEDGESLVVRIDFHTREMLISGDPDVFYVTDHYLAYPWILVRLPAVRREVLRKAIEDAWRRSAPRQLAAAFDRSRER